MSSIQGCGFFGHIIHGGYILIKVNCISSHHCLDIQLLSQNNFAHSLNRKPASWKNRSSVLSLAGRVNLTKFLKRCKCSLVTHLYISDSFPFLKKIVLFFFKIHIIYIFKDLLGLHHLGKSSR